MGQGKNICKHHVNMKINEKPTTIYVNARKMRWGHDFSKDKGEGMLTLKQFGKIHVSWGKPIKTVNYPFSYLSSQPFILP